MVLGLVKDCCTDVELIDLSADWKGKCPSCGKSFPGTCRIQPTLIEWMEWVNDDCAVDQTGDFLWADTALLARAEVAHDIFTEFTSIDLFEVFIIDDPSALDSQYPYSRQRGLPRRSATSSFFELRPKVKVGFDRERTTRVEDSCSTCRRTFVQPMGWEEYLPIYDRDLKEVVTHHTHRAVNTGLFISREQIGDADWFRVDALGGLGNFNFCTDRAKDFITSRAYSNIRFLEVGEIFSD